MNGDITDPDEFHDEADTLIGTDQLQIIAMSRGYWGNSIRVALINRSTQVQVLSADSYADTSLDSTLFTAVYNVDSPISENDQFLLNPGKPILPKYTKVFEIPFGATNINIKVTSSEKIQKTG